MTRGLHRIAYNVLAHVRGGLFVRTRFRFLRELVLDLDAITPRAFVLDHTGILPALQAKGTSRTKRRWTSQAHVVNGSDGEPDLVRIEIGPAAFFVSVRASTAALATVVTGNASAAWPATSVRQPDRHCGVRARVRASRRSARERG
jgi:hypothetical protein